MIIAKFYEITVEGYGIKFYCPFCNEYHYHGAIRPVLCDKCEGMVFNIDYSTEIYQYQNGDVVGYVAEIDGELYAFLDMYIDKPNYLYQLALKCKNKILKRLDDENLRIYVDKIHDDVNMFVYKDNITAISISFLYEPNKSYVFSYMYSDYSKEAVKFNVANLSFDKIVNLLEEKIKEVIEN